LIAPACSFVVIDAPDLRLLAYAPTKPMLRVVRLPKATAEPAPVSLDTGFGLDRCIRRDGWLVFTPNVDVYELPLPFGERPFRVATDTHVVAAGVDQRTVWLRERSSPTIAEYDGVTREVRRQVELPGPEFYVSAATRSGFVLGHEEGLYLWELSQPPRLLLDDAAGGRANEQHTRIICWRFSTDEAVILDLSNESQVTVRPPEGSRWGSGIGIFSPDGQWLAVDLDYSAPKTQAESMATIHAIASGANVAYEPQPRRLGVIRCADGTLTLADRVHDNFANIVWSRDSKWIIFTTPFAPRGLWLTRPDELTLEWISFGRKHAPSLLCDASDLIS
jgi:hypothetical protein